MSILAIIESGVVANVIVADEWPNGIDVTELTPQPGIGWLYDGQGFTPPAAEPEPQPDQNPDGEGPFLSNYAFDMRYTLLERIAIKQLADQRNPDGSFTTTAYAVQVNVERAAKAKFVNPQRAETRNGVMQFVALGVLTEARALEILDSPIQPFEAYTP